VGRWRRVDGEAHAGRRRCRGAVRGARVTRVDGAPILAHDGVFTRTVNVPDRATGQIVRIPVRRFCAEAAAGQPDPAGNLVVEFIVVDGHLRGEYFRPVFATHNGFTSETAGPPVDPATAQQGIAQQRARAVLICNRAKKLRMVTLPMCH
jgi:hypothetical protein